MPTDTLELEGAVDLVVLPITLGLRAGTMRLAGGRLTYTRRWRRRVLLDAPVGELHSVARSSWGTGFHLWHGSTRYRFVVNHPVRSHDLGPGALAGAAEAIDQVRQGLVKTALSRAEVDRWHDALAAVIAPSPPAGVEVRGPLSTTRFLVAMIGGATAATLALVAVITAVVVGVG